MGQSHWTSEHDFTVGGVAYRSMTGRTQDDQMVVLKPREAVDGYEALFAELKPRTMVELGIYNGGSAALFSQLATPEKFVVVDIGAGCEPLDRFLDRHDLRGTVVPYFGVDQADTGRLDEIMAAEFDGPVDLVIDDASHLEAETRTSFNRLFPHVRPGGAYVIEDWGWAHTGLPRDAYMQGVPPLSVFIVELLVVAARRPRMIDRLVIDSFSATVWRGPADLRSGRFDVSAHLGPVGQDMLEGLQVARSQVP